MMDLVWQNSVANDAEIKIQQSMSDLEGVLGLQEMTLDDKTPIPPQRVPHHYDRCPEF